MKITIGHPAYKDENSFAQFSSIRKATEELMFRGYKREVVREAIRRAKANRGALMTISAVGLLTELGIN